MELYILYFSIFALLIFVIPIIAITLAVKSRREIDAVNRRIESLESELREIRREGIAPGEKPPLKQTLRAAAPTSRSAMTPEEPPLQPSQAVSSTPPALTPEPRPLGELFTAERMANHAKANADAGQELKAGTAGLMPPLAWEQFMGAKLFAWIGGLALFLGIGFFVKYSFDHNLISPETRVAIGFLAGAGLILGGVLMKRKENAVTAQTLCATGIVVLYAVTFACRSFYHFQFFGVLNTFALMALITGAAFLLSVKMDALVVAVLGVAGGFLTPVLLSTGQDNAVGLFGYIALLDIGLLAIAKRKHWKVLPWLGMTGTVLTQGAWIAEFFVPGGYFAGGKIFIPMVVMLGFQTLFLLAAWLARKEEETEDFFSYPALLMGGSAMLCAFYFSSFAEAGPRLVLLSGYLFLADLGLIALSCISKRLARVRMAAGIVAYIFLGAWTATYLTDPLLFTALGCYFVFALFHSALPLVLRRIEKTPAPLWCHLFPGLSIVLILMPIFEYHTASILIWPFVLLIDVLAFLVSIFTMTLVPVFAVLILTLIALGGVLLQVPMELTGLPTDLSLLGGCAVFFVAAGAWAGNRIAGAERNDSKLFGSINNPANSMVQIPALSTVLPFLLLIMVVLRLPERNPSPVFGLALLLVILLLGLAKILAMDVLPMVGLISIVALEHACLQSPFYLRTGMIWLSWNLLFYAIFTLFPFAFCESFRTKKAPWIASALAGPLHFYLIYDLAKVAFPEIPHGLIPAMFAVPSLAGLAVLVKDAPANPARNTQLAFFGGVALFFITLIFPLQFDHEWVTISWGLEGAALCWLFHRVPHAGLRLAGAGLLAVSFARLGLNPYVLGYHARAGMPILNWYLYAYGTVSVALFGGARLLERPRNMIAKLNVPPFLYSMGTFLLFLIVNIEIADYFTAPATKMLTFDFSGSFARDMTYSIAWALFSLILLVVGIRNRSAAVRYASLALLSITVLKLFLHDLSELDQLYRIGAFIAVAVIAILASFLYQRFLAVVAPESESAQQQ